MVENFSWLWPMGTVNTNFGRCEFSESMNTNSILSHKMVRNVHSNPPPPAQKTKAAQNHFQKMPFDLELNMFLSVQLTA